MHTELSSAFRPFAPAVYNDLLEVGPADRELWSREGRAALFQEIGALIVKHDLQESLGLCLLHHHNAVEDDHIMVETFEADSYATPALVMARIPQQQAQDYVPVAMKVSDRGLMPLEYSSVDLAHRNYSRLGEVGNGFVTDFCDLVTRYGFEDLVGLSVLRLDALDRQPGEELIERTDYRRVANIMRAHDTEEREGINHVQTSWKFDKIAFASYSSPDDAYVEGKGSSTASSCVTKCEASSNPDDPHIEEHESSVASSCVTKCEAPSNPDDPHIEEHESSVASSCVTKCEAPSNPDDPHIEEHESGVASSCVTKCEAPSNPDDPHIEEHESGVASSCVTKCEAPSNPDDPHIEEHESGVASSCVTKCEAPSNPDDPHIEEHESSVASSCVTKCEAPSNPDDPHIEEHEGGVASSCVTKCEAPSNPDDPHIEEHESSEDDGYSPQQYS